MTCQGVVWRGEAWHGKAWHGVVCGVIVASSHEGLTGVKNDGVCMVLI